MSDYEKGRASRQRAAKAATAKRTSVPQVPRKLSPEEEAKATYQAIQAAAFRQRELYRTRSEAERLQREAYGDYLFAREPDDTKFPPAYWQREGATTSEKMRTLLFQLIGNGDASDDLYYWESYL